MTQLELDFGEEFAPQGKIDEIVEMARQTASHGVEHPSGEVSFVFYNEHLRAFENLVRQKVLEDLSRGYA